MISNSCFHVSCYIHVLIFLAFRLLLRNVLNSNMIRKIIKLHYLKNLIFQSRVGNISKRYETSRSVRQINTARVPPMITQNVANVFYWNIFYFMIQIFRKLFINFRTDFFYTRLYILKINLTLKRIINKVRKLANIVT